MRAQFDNPPRGVGLPRSNIAVTRSAMASAEHGVIRQTLLESLNNNHRCESVRVHRGHRRLSEEETMKLYFDPRTVNCRKVAAGLTRENDGALLAGMINGMRCAGGVDCATSCCWTFNQTE